MSRSIHTTHRGFNKLRKMKFSSAQEKMEALRKAGRDLYNKHEIKHETLVKRHRAVPNHGVVRATMVPIEVFDEGPYVHHPISEDDLRATIDALPAYATEGLKRIQLSLGKEHHDEKWGECLSEENVDPFTGRIASRLAGDIYIPITLGWCGEDGLICIYAYVYDENRIRISKTVLEMLLKFITLIVFTHELAHHYENCGIRIRTRLWRRREEYAVATSQKWMRDHVVPYLEKTYPDQIRELLAWFALHSGVEVSLKTLVGNPERGKRISLWWMDGGIMMALTSLLEDVCEGRDRIEVRISFAQMLHCMCEHNWSLAVLDTVLAEEPDNVSALSLKASILGRIKRYDEAFPIAQRVLRQNPVDEHAREVLAEVLVARREWNQLLEYCTEWKNAVGQVKLNRDRYYTAVAYCGLGEDAKMEVHVQHYAATRHRNISVHSQKFKRRLTCIGRRVYQDAGRPVPPHLRGATRD